MALKLKDGDYVLCPGTGPEGVRGGQQVLERVLFRLTARRGSFPFLPGLGSRLYLLGREKPSAREVAARQYVMQALEEEKEVSVTGVELAQEGETARLTVRLLWQGEELEAAVPLEGV